MGTFSIWHWIIVLSVFGAPVIAIASASREKTLSRLPYFWRVASLIAATLVLRLLVEVLVSEPPSVAGAIVGLGWIVALVIFGILGALWSVHRVQEVGASKWWSLLLLVPAVNLIHIAFLFFYSGQKAKQSSPAA